MENGANDCNKDILRMFEYLQNSDPFIDYEYKKKIKELESFREKYIKQMREEAELQRKATKELAKAEA